jgi:hypothetical protein
MTRSLLRFPVKVVLDLLGCMQLNAFVRFCVCDANGGLGGSV